MEQPQITLITYANSGFEKRQKAIREAALKSKVFDSVYDYTEDWLRKQKFYFENYNVLNEARGNGLFLWKPYILLQTLKEVSANDIIMYIDCGDTLNETETLKEFLLNKMKGIDILLTDGAYKNSAYTKRDCFVEMNCDNEKYYNALQVEAGIVVCKKTAFTISIFETWLKYCKMRHVISDDENILGLRNLEGFKDSRHDQSVLSLLKSKNNLYSSGEMRKYVTCNVNQTE